MTCGQTLQQRRRYWIQCAALIAAIFLVTPACAAQAAPADQTPEMPWTRDLKKYPGLAADLEVLVDRLQNNLQYPAPRAESHLLPLLPESSMIYMAFPNYGDVTHQALTIFRQTLEEKPVLRDWWQHGELASGGPKVVDALEKVYQLSQYLGDELVVSGGKENADVSGLVIAEVRKPGLKNLLQQMVNELAGKSKPGVRILDPQELATAEDKRPAWELVVLVRPDFVAAALDVASLRRLNARLDRGSREFVSAAFGQRIAQAYGGGVSVVGAVDLHRILGQIPTGGEQGRLALQRSGFADVKYLVWEHRSVGGQGISQAELSFTGPRHGVAAWLAAPGPLGSLDFVSPKAILAGTVVLTSPAQIFDDVKELTGASGAGAFATLGQSEQALKLSLKEDLLKHLGGEMTVELDEITPPDAVWKAMLQVNDPDHVQQTLSTLLAMTPFTAGQFDDGGITYHTIRIPSEQKIMELGYAFVDGYLIIASSKETALEAVQLHRSGESLGKSRKLLEAVPPGRSPSASALLYQDPGAMTAVRLGQLSPEMAGPLARWTRGGTPTVMWVYGEETAIRGASTNAAIEAAAVVLVGAAIAIPNLLRSRMAANEASAVGSLRTLNVACVTYSTTYGTGFPRQLSNLGTSGAASATSADLIDNVLASGAKSGYSFTYSPGAATNGVTPTYTIQANPITPGQTGQRYFFTDQSGVIRFNISRPATSSDPPLS